MSLLDTSKPVYKVIGKIEDGRRMMVYVNADNTELAIQLGMSEGLVSIDETFIINSYTGLRL